MPQKESSSQEKMPDKNLESLGDDLRRVRKRVLEEREWRKQQDIEEIKRKSSNQLGDPENREKLQDAIKKALHKKGETPKQVKFTEDKTEEKSSEESPAAEENQEDILEKSLEEINKLDRKTVAHLIEGGASDEQIISVAERLQEFTKFDGSSYYLSDQNKEKFGEPEKHKRQWRCRSVAGHRSEGDVQKNLFSEHIPRELAHYRDLLSAFGGTSKMVTAISHLENQDGKQPNQMKEKLLKLAESGEYKQGKSESENQKKELTGEIEKNDLVYYMEKEMRRWSDPKEIVAIKIVDNKEYAKFADDDSLYPLSKLKKAEEVQDSQYRPGPKDVAPASGDLEAVPSAAELAQEVEEETPEEFADNPEAQAVAAEIEKMSPEEREKIDGSLQNLGHKAEQLKSYLQKKTYGLLANSLGNKDGDSTMAKWFGALSERAAAKETRSIEARKVRQNSDSKAKEFFKDKWKLTSNVLKGGSMFFSPHVWLMTIGYATSAGGEAGKEVRFDNEELLEQTRYKDAEKAAEEAWAVYEQAEKLSGGDDEVTREILQDAYTKHLPKNILKRLQDFEESQPDTYDDIEEAHRVANRLQKVATHLAEDKGSVQTEDFQMAVEKLFKDPQPGQNTAFWGKLFEKQIIRLAKKTRHKFVDIEMNDSLSEEEKEKQKQAYLNKWGRSKTLQDYDRMLTEQGKIDNWAMAAHEAQRAGQVFVGGAMALTFWKGLSYLPGIFTSSDAMEGAGEVASGSSSPSELGGDSGSLDDAGQTVLGGADSSESGTAKLGPDNAENQTAAQPGGEGRGSAQNENVLGGEGQGSAQKESVLGGEDSGSSQKDPVPGGEDQGTAEKEVVLGGSNQLDLEEGFTTQEADSTRTAGGNVMPGPDAEQLEVPKPPLGPQEFIIDEDGEGMIHAIADGLEDKYNISHEKAMELGNKLFIKGEQLKGDDELFNLVGKGATFQLDFGDLTASDLEDLSADELIEQIDFDNETGFDAGESGIKGLELPADEYDPSVDQSGRFEDTTIQRRELEGVTFQDLSEEADMVQEQARQNAEAAEAGRQAAEGSIGAESLELGAAAEAESGLSSESSADTAGGEQSAVEQTSEAEISSDATEVLREDVAERGTTSYLNDRVDDLLTSIPEDAGGEYRGISVNSLNELNDYMDAHRNQDMVTLAERMSQDNPRLLLTLDRLVNLNENPPGSLLDRLSGFISNTIKEAEESGRLSEAIREKIAVDKAHLDALASAEVTPRALEEMTGELNGLSSDLNQYADKTNKGPSTRDSVKKFDDILKNFERAANKTDVDAGSRFFGKARDLLDDILIDNLPR